MKPEMQTGQSPRHHAFAALAGLLLGVALVKFGNPVILESKIQTPQTFWEFFYQPWPVHWGYIFLGATASAGLACGKLKPVGSRWIFFLPLLWLAWQCVSATQTVSPELTRLTLLHFTATVGCFYLGWFALAEVRDLRLFWLGVLAGFFWVLREGFDQRFGGLESTRQYFYLYILPQLKEPPVELMRKMSTNRIFSTLFYPNTLAGAILLFLPVTIAGLLDWTRPLKPGSRGLLIGFFVCAALACLYWSGSKSGWLLMLGLGGARMWHIQILAAWRKWILITVMAAGLAGFFIRYAGFFEKGATSVAARGDYWKAAGQIFLGNPVLGTGPGTFSIPYQQIKPPESEMARLAHNDYLQQASDSGFFGFLAYIAFISGILWVLYRKSDINIYPRRLALWLGIAAVCLQGFSEFNLYIPALAWPVFLFLGYFWETASAHFVSEPSKPMYKPNGND